MHLQYCRPPQWYTASKDGLLMTVCSVIHFLLGYTTVLTVSVYLHFCSLHYRMHALYTLCYNAATLHFGLGVHLCVTHCEGSIFQMDSLQVDI